MSRRTTSRLWSSGSSEALALNELKLREQVPGQGQWGSTRVARAGTMRPFQIRFQRIAAKRDCVSGTPASLALGAPVFALAVRREGWE